MWDVAGMLPLITCDGLPFARRLWVDSEFQTRDTQADRVTDGAISVDLNAVGITVNNSGTIGQRLYADGNVQCSLLNNAATATLTNSGGVFGQVLAKQDIVLSAGDQTMTRPTEAQDSLSLISCASPTGRYVTAHTPSVDNSSSVASGLWVIQQAGFPGYTNQPILGLQNHAPGSGVWQPDALSWACSALVFRDGEMIGTATAQRGSVTPQFVSRSQGIDTGWRWGYNASHPIETLRNYTWPTIFGDTVALNKAIDDRVPSQYRAFVVTYRVGHILYNYITPVGVIVKGNGFSYLSPLFVDTGWFSPTRYTGPYFIPAGGIITVAIPHAIDGDIDPLGEITATQFDGLMNASQWDSLTQEEGSYLCVSMSTDACDPANLLHPVANAVMRGPRFEGPCSPGSGKTNAQQTTIFNSFVVDKTPPPLWWNVFDDMTTAEAAQKTQSDWLAESIKSDEPIGYWRIPPYGTSYTQIIDFDGAAALNRWTPKHYGLKVFSSQFKFQQQANFNWQQDYQPLAPGEYTINAVDIVTDAAGNAALEQPSVTFKVFEGTEDELRGRPRFEIPFEDPQSRVGGAIFGGRKYPVTQVDVVFASNVYGFTKRHFELKGFGRYLDKSVEPPQLANGEIPQLMYEFPPDQANDNKTEMDRIVPRGITKVEQLSSTRVRLTLDSAMQLPGSRWRLFFTPDKQVFQFDEQPEGFKLEYKQTPPFRAEDGRLVGETQLWQIHFSDGVTWPFFWDVDQNEWKIPWGGAEYNAGDQIDSEDPFAGKLQSVGAWIKFKKQVQMACRMNWVVVRPETMRPQRIEIGALNPFFPFFTHHHSYNSGGEIIGIGGVSSVTAEIAEPESNDEPWRSQIAASGSMWLSKTPGTFQSGSPDSADAFVPSVPASPTAQTSEPYSYWGLDTTIYPSAPKLLRSCKAPKSHQPQASVFHGGENFGIQATLSRVVVPGSDGFPAAPGPGIRGFPGLFGPILYSYSPFRVDGRYLYSGGTDADQFVTLFQNLSFAATGVPNRWSARPSATANIGTFVSALNIDRTAVKNLGEIHIYSGSTDTSLPLEDGSFFNFGETTPIIAGCGEFTLQARRTCTQHRGLRTAAPNEIVITISGTVGYNGASAKVPKYWKLDKEAWVFAYAGVSGASASYTADLVLSQEQEAALVSGQAVAVVSDKMSDNVYGGTFYAARHVWNLQRI